MGGEKGRSFSPHPAPSPAFEFFSGFVSIAGAREECLFLPRLLRGPNDAHLALF